MIKCPNCAAENRAEAAACYYCGYTFSGSAERPTPTQPVRVRPPSPESQPGGSPDPGATQPGANVYPPEAQTQPGVSAYPPEAQTQPGANAYPPSGQTLPYAPGQPAYDPNDPNYPGGPVYDPNAATYPGQPVYDPNAPGMPPGAPQPPVKSGLERFWPVLIGALVIVFLCAGAIVVWTFSALIGGGSTRLGRDVATQAAEILPLPAEETATPEEPTPWPTFTALPTFTLAPTEVQPTATQPPAPTATPQPQATATTPPQPTAASPSDSGGSGGPQPTLNPTQAVDLEKLLSPECAGALDTLSDLGSQATSNPASLFDSRWRANLNQTIDQVNDNCGSLDSASPLPGIVSDARGELNQATEAFDTATRLLNEGIREWNFGKVMDAAREARAATEHLNKAITALGKLRGD